MDHHIMMIIIISEINIYILRSPLAFWSLYLPDVPSFMLNLDNSDVEWYSSFDTKMIYINKVIYITIDDH